MGNNYCVGSRKYKRSLEDQLFHVSIEQQLDMLKEIPYKQQKCITYKDKPIMDLLKLIDINNNCPLQIESGQQPKQEQLQETTSDEFTLYAELGVEIIKSIQQKIDDFRLQEKSWILLLDDSKSPHFLKLFVKQVQLTDGNKINATISQFVVPCKPEKFISFMGNFQDQIKLDPRIDQFKCIKKHPEKQEQLIYLSYKSMALVSARDFVYFKKTEIINQQNSIWCDASRSIVDNSICPIQNKIVRGEIQLSGYVIQPLQNLMDQDYFQQRFMSIAFKAESYSLVQLCSECDFKLSVPLYLAKGQIKQEMANYINLVYRSLL